MRRGSTVTMKILIITNHSYMLYRFRKELIQHLMKDHEVVLSMPFVGHEEDFQAMGIRCIDTKMGRREIRPIDEVKLFSFYFSLLAKERPDCVITYSIKPNTYAGICCRILGIPYYANVQGLGTAFMLPKLEKAVTLLYKVALRKARMVFFENNSNAGIFATKGILPNHKITILPGAGINLSEYPVAPYPDNEVFRFLYLGRIMREKGIAEVLDAARQLHQKYGPRFVLDIVGFFDYEDFSAQFKELEELGIVRFHGFQPDPRPYYAQTECLVMPSYHEGMSNVLLEAATMGRPLITTDIPGCREAVEANVTGLLCQAKDTKTLFECMEKMLLMPREDRAAMGMAGRDKMIREFDREYVVEKIVRILESGSKATA